MSIAAHPPPTIQADGIRGGYLGTLGLLLGLGIGLGARCFRARRRPAVPSTALTEQNCAAAALGVLAQHAAVRENAKRAECASRYEAYKAAELRMRRGGGQRAPLPLHRALGAACCRRDEAIDELHAQRDILQCLRGAGSVARAARPGGCQPAWCSWGGRSPTRTSSPARPWWALRSSWRSSWPLSWRGSAPSSPASSAWRRRRRRRLGAGRRRVLHDRGVGRDARAVCVADALHGQKRSRSSTPHSPTACEGRGSSVHRAATEAEAKQLLSRPDLFPLPTSPMFHVGA